MKFVRYIFQGKIAYGVLEDQTIKVIKGNPYNKIVYNGVNYQLRDVKLLAPVKPQKIICLGLNYRDHAAEMGLELPTEPVVFLKPPTAVIGPGENIRLTKMATRNDYEAELAIVIKNRARHIAPDKGENYILGFTCANDFTARSLQPKDGQWTIAKSFDTYCPLGPWIESELDTENLKIETLQNGEVRQSSTTANLIFKPGFLVSYLSQIMTLCPGDVILTGTPAGIGGVNPGDQITIRIQGIGELTNPCIAEV